MDARATAALARRASGAAGRHADRRTNRLRTKKARNDAAIKEQR